MDIYHDLRSTVVGLTDQDHPASLGRVAKVLPPVAPATLHAILVQREDVGFQQQHEDKTEQKIPHPRGPVMAVPCDPKPPSTVALAMFRDHRGITQGRGYHSLRYSPPRTTV